MTDGITYYQKKKKIPDTIGEALKGHFDKPKKKVCAYEWQDRAFMISEKLGINWKENRKYLSGWLKLFKTGNPNKLDRCYSFIYDYPKQLNSEAKIKLFYWKYNRKAEEY